MATYRLAEPTTDTLHPDPLISQLLYNRSVTTDTAADFLSPDYVTHRHDPFLLHQMDVAVDRILTAIKNKERIAVYADYDCDGIPGAVVLNDFLRAVEHDNVTTYIPHRHYEGFGLHASAVEKLAADEVDLIITIDCGTASITAVAKAVELGIDVIVTDHHEAGAELPAAFAIVNPKLGDTYPFSELCGAGVIFKVIEAALQKGDFNLTPGKEKWWLDMVGVATINDMVPLVGENRVLAHYGLQVLRKSRRPGLQQLLKKARANQAYLTEDDVGFTIGPRINAASRMDTPEDAFAVLTTEDIEEAGAKVEHLEQLNNERKGLVAAMTKELNKRLRATTDLPPVLVLGNPDWRPALVGLAATKLAEEYQRPAFIWGRDGNGKIKGSCRSEGITSVVTLMESAKDAFTEFGGHAFSGGFAVADDAIFSLPEKLSEAFVSLGQTAGINQEVLIDAELKLEDITPDLFTKLRTLAPYGVGNPKPLFMFKNIVPQQVEQFGKTKEHLKIQFEDSGRRHEAIAFFATPKSYVKTPEAGGVLTLIAHPEQSYFMGRIQNRLRIVDIT